ncbi:YhgE/Pip domain-containing protein [Herbiconiux moechotypicola]|uniref:ABC-2 type transporter transmembrane domain-containing protein n=1 Tax=Herbiconiux moechotypicola TaxID=637393 RepID=A0ABP5QK97_9MICO|nr:YhgE/Pip domain-containing protein [Herbiconiux moechotypicola]MCS5730188.1 YhgE/Pip domain-containing protein [Herbiconiux moechotypicola]
MSASSSAPAPRIRRRTKIALFVLATLAVVLTPLAVNGLFAGALANVDTNITTIPAAIVNNDEMTTTTAADGTESTNFAGRAVVTELTGGDSGFDWTVTNSEDAAAGLAEGRYYAVMTIPENFSASIDTLGSTEPVQAPIDIRTDAAHGYLSGIVASTVGSAVQAEFGQFVTAQVVNGIYTSFGTVGTSLTDAADGAAQLADGADGIASGNAQLADGLGQLSSGAAEAASGGATLADGLGQLSTGAASAGTGATQLADGLGQLSGGAASAASGATALAGGVGQLSTGASDLAGGLDEFRVGVRAYTDGVSQLAGGLDALAEQTTGLGDLSAGVAAYTTGVTASAQGAQQLAAAAAADPTVPAYLVDGLAQLSGGLTQLDAGSAQLAEGASGLPLLEQGIAQTASGADQLADGGSQIADGADQLATGASALASGVAQTATGADQLAGGVGQLAGGLAETAPGASQLADGVNQIAGGLAQSAPGAATLADGVSQLATGVAQTVPGAQQLADGATQLGDGARELSDGLTSGAEQLTANTPTDTEQAADVVAQPVAVDSVTTNQVSNVGQVVSTIMLPVALWLGALAVFLWLRPLSRAVLASAASTGRLTARVFVRAAAIVAVQVALLVAFLHIVLGASWSSLPATLGFSLLVALAFTALQQLLRTAFGRLGSVISLVLLALQLAATGGLYPVELLSGPFQVINTISPLSYAVNGIQTILTGGDAAVVVQASLVMVGILLVSLVLSGVALARRRRPAEIGWLVPARTMEA